MQNKQTKNVNWKTYYFIATAEIPLLKNMLFNSQYHELTLTNKQNSKAFALLQSKKILVFSQ